MQEIERQNFWQQAKHVTHSRPALRGRGMPSNILAHSRLRKSLIFASAVLHRGFLSERTVTSVRDTQLPGLTRQNAKALASQQSVMHCQPHSHLKTNLIIISSSHQSLNHEGRWGPIDDFATSSLISPCSPGLSIP